MEGSRGLESDGFAAVDLLGYQIYFSQDLPGTFEPGGYQHNVKFAQADFQGFYSGCTNCICIEHGLVGVGWDHLLFASLVVDVEAKTDV